MEGPWLQGANTVIGHKVFVSVLLTYITQPLQHPIMPAFIKQDHIKSYYPCHFTS